MRATRCSEAFPTIVKETMRLMKTSYCEKDVLPSLMPFPTPNPGCPSNTLGNLFRCFEEVIPEPGSIVVPILGGGNADYAQNMCEGERWKNAVECTEKITENCLSDDKMSEVLKLYFKKDNFESGLKSFCSTIKTYKDNALCYRRQRDELWKCRQKEGRDFLTLVQDYDNLNPPDIAKRLCA